MAFVGVFPTRWFRCVRHAVVFPGFDPIWSKEHHENCNLRTISRMRSVVIINDLDYDPRNRETQRVLMCSECSGWGLLVAYDPITKHTEVCCERCKGWGYV